MTTEAEKKATSSTARSGSATKKGASSRQKVIKPAGKKTSAKKAGTKPKVAVKTKGKAPATKRKKAVKRKGFIALKTPTMYDIHPMRKYIELLLYSCYSGRSPDFETELGINELDSIQVNKTQLQTKIKTKKELTEVKKTISRGIMIENHPDQKILMWDYLKNASLPTSIDLKYHFVPVEVKNMLKTFQQRRVIEGYATMGFTPEEIADVVNRNPELIHITPIQVEVYQYFFWNLDSSGIMSVYPVQVLANYILQLRSQILSNYREIIKQHEKLGTLTNEIKSRLTGVVFINTPYYLCGEEDVYISWNKLVFEERKIALDSFKPIVAVSNGDISPAKLNSMIQVSDYSVLTFDQQLQELSQAFVNAAESAMEENPFRAMEMVKGGLLPLAQTMLLFNIPKKDAGSNLGSTTKVYVSKAKMLKVKAGKALIIDPHEDKRKRQREMLKDATDADFSDMPIDSEAGHS